MYTGNTLMTKNHAVINSVYPCVYREHVDVNSIDADFPRFIPVYTGNTDNSFSHFKRNPVYPCVYREHWSASCAEHGIAGLSLCIQGTHDLISRPELR